ncbi:TPA: hypothetical protein MHP90_27775, partial [Klebsiella pneumoniae subsp. pneumoniae]|nr:hypothetical protein [Klebsiella pneumoniae subsp. pneumoniae]
LVSNIGSIKATNVYIDIEFPDAFLIYENDDTFSEPESPLPVNPIIRAKSEYSKNKYMQNSALSRLQTQLGGGYSVMDRFPSLNNNLSFLSKI